MKSLTGFWQLLRLAVRRDRIKLPLIIIAIASFMSVNIPALIDLYGGNQQEQLSYVRTVAPSVVNRVFGGPIYGPEIGEIILNETLLFTAIAVAFMSILTVVRHTRQNEETGRSELIGSAVVGHHASLAAALTIAVGANVVLALLFAATFIGNGLPALESVAASAAITSVGIAFASVAAITAQLSGTARGANSLAAIVLGVSFLVRAIGDSLGQLVRGGLGVESAWPSWLSPLGWAQQIYAFSETNWWIFGLFGLFFAGASGVAFVLNAHRDLGLSILPDQPGPAHAKPSLLSPLGLAWRLQRGTLRGWAITILILGVTVGFVGKEFRQLFEDPDLAEALGGFAFNDNFADVFFASMMSLTAIVLGGYVVQSLLRVRSEESSGRAEPILATSVSRTNWVLSHAGITAIGLVVLLAVMGISSGSTYVMITDSAASEILTITKAALVQLPALLAFGGFVMLLFGLLPGWSMAIAWTSFAVTYLLAQFAFILDIPQAVLNLSPFEHTPAVPVEDISILPIAALLLIAGGFATAGLTLFRRRDLTTS